MALILIAATDQENGIGTKDGKLLFRYPKDLKRFKEITTNKHVVMGRKTWESLPVKPLPKRKNYILTTDETFEVKGRTKVLHDIEEVIQMSKKTDVYVIGGGQLYAQLIHEADVLLLTHIHIDAAEKGMEVGVYFPAIDVKEWKLFRVSPQEADDKHPTTFTYAEYRRKRHEPTETE